MDNNVTEKISEELKKKATVASIWSTCSLVLLVVGIAGSIYWFSSTAIEGVTKKGVEGLKKVSSDLTQLIALHNHNDWEIGDENALDRFIIARASQVISDEILKNSKFGTMEQLVQVTTESYEQVIGVENDATFRTTLAPPKRLVDISRAAFNGTCPDHLKRAVAVLIYHEVYNLNEGTCENNELYQAATLVSDAGQLKAAAATRIKKDEVISSKIVENESNALNFAEAAIQQSTFDANALMQVAITRVGAVAIAIFGIQMALSFFRFFSKLAAMYNSRATSVLVFASGDDKELLRFVESIKPESIAFGKEPDAPVTQLIDLIKLSK